MAEKKNTFVVRMETDNDAFEDWHTEVARILRDVADQLDRDDGRSGFPGGACLDVNGNYVGFWQKR